MAAVLDLRYKMRWISEMSEIAKLEEKLDINARKQYTQLASDSVSSPPRKIKAYHDELFSFMPPVKKSRHVSGYYDPYRIHDVILC